LVVVAAVAVLAQALAVVVVVELVAIVVMSPLKKLVKTCRQKNRYFSHRVRTRLLSEAGAAGIPALGRLAVTFHSLLLSSRMVVAVGPTP
jgi:nitrate/nitrite-specific signal transduction histidine kinase